MEEHTHTQTVSHQSILYVNEHKPNRKSFVLIIAFMFDATLR